MTIAAMMSVGILTRYSGLDATMGLAFARTGHLYPFFGTLLGWLGVALTGRQTLASICAIRQLARKFPRAANRHLSGVDGGGRTAQAWRDGEDDRCAEYRSGQHGDRMVRT